MFDSIIACPTPLLLASGFFPLLQTILPATSRGNFPRREETSGVLRDWSLPASLPGLCPSPRALSSGTGNVQQLLTLLGAFQGSMLCVFYSSCWNFFSPFLSYSFPYYPLSSHSWSLSGELICIFQGPDQTSLFLQS